MSEFDASSAPAAGAEEGPAPATGQATTTGKAATVAPSTPSSGQPTRAAAPAEQPQASRESALGWKSVQDAERDYKALQAAYTRITQEVKGLGADFPTIKQEREFLSNLRGHPGFLQWAQSELAKATTGSGDPDTVRALEIVQAEAKRIAEAEVAPLKQQALEMRAHNTAETAFQELGRLHGPEWQQYKPQMLALHAQDIQAGRVHPSMEYLFDTQYVHDLLARATSRDPNYAATQYQRRLQAKQANTTTSSPGAPASAVGTGKINSFDDAFRAAKAQLGLA